jgi:hypothetical protein
VLVKDTEWLVDDAKQQAIEAHHQQVNGWIRDQLQHAYLVADPSQSIANAERQLGKPLTIWVFKKEVQKLRPSLRFNKEFIAHPLVNKERWRIYHHGNFITAIDDIIPEWSLFGTQEKIGVPYNHKVAGKADIPHHEITRGWRTVLINLVARGLLTPAQVERFAAKHGSEDRPSWAHLVGKSKQEKGVL